MKIIKQKAIFKVVRPQIVEYICDKCGKVTGTRDNPKQTISVTDSGDCHYCKKTCNFFKP